jgi:hypothetical protein
MKKPLKERLVRGRGALARHGDFWYPVRVISTEDGEDWRVRWWMGCTFKEPGIDPGSITIVPVANLIDSLWQDRAGRRNIRASCIESPTKSVLTSYDSSDAGYMQIRDQRLKISYRTLHLHHTQKKSTI